MIFTKGNERVTYNAQTGTLSDQALSEGVKSLAGESFSIDMVPLVISDPPTVDEVAMIMTSLGFDTDYSVIQEHLNWDNETSDIELVN